jgi:hypothetical protein
MGCVVYLMWTMQSQASKRCEGSKQQGHKNVKATSNTKCGNLLSTEQPTVKSAFSGRSIHRRMSSKKTKGHVGPKQKQPRQLQNHAFLEPKSKKDCQVVEATTSADPAVEGGGDIFRVELQKANNLVPHR